MKQLALTVIVAFAVFAFPAFAGETYLGTIVSGAGADTTNASTATPFKVLPGSRLTIACTAVGFIAVDTLTAVTNLAGANPGTPVAINERFATIVKVLGPRHGGVTAAAGGSIVRISGAAAVTCAVWSRDGDEGVR